ncbi:MAG: response regulator [Burkholderiales bacterium]|nr:response regulator [Phycisphaerae bacterium]
MIAIVFIAASATAGLAQTAPPVDVHVHPTTVDAATENSSFFGDFLKTYTPRRLCMFNEEPVIWLHAVSDLLIGVAYFTIPFSLMVFLRRRRDIAFGWMFKMFAAFILACGTTHFIGLLDLWRPYYRLDGVVKAITAGLSVATAIALWRLIPKAVAIPSSAQLEATVLTRTAELQKANEDLRIEVQARTRESSERIEAQKALAESESRFKLLANTIPQLAWMARPDGYIFWYNQRWHDYCGTTPEQMAGWGWTNVHDPKEVARVIESWKASLASGQDWEDIFPLRRNDGTFRAHLSRARPLRDAAGNITFWFGTNTDIEEQRRITEERTTLLESERAARAEAERAGRLKDEFLATLSHELRTPLTAILGWSQLLRRHHQEDQKLNEGLAIIERNSRLQAQLIEDLLDMSRIISGKLRIDVQQVQVADIINTAIESVMPAADAKGIRLQKVVDTHLNPLRGDPNRLQQVLWNLLSNAIKFTPREGKVVIAAQRINSHVEITVTDSGSGIKADFLPYVFERFRQADGSTTRRHGGLGLGLAITKNLVELHGGKIRAKSAGEGLGASFVIELPLVVVHPGDPETGRDHPARPDPRAPINFGTDCESLADISVLVVDDEEDARSLIGRVLEECHAKVYIAGSSSAALEILKSELPSVIVSDIGMPNEDGYAFIRKVRELPPEQGGRTPAAALTAFARSEDRMRALRAGYQSHVAKPVEPGELVAVVASLARQAEKKE